MQIALHTYSTFQYFVFLGGAERESHLLTGTPPVVVVVEEKAVAR